MVAAPSLLQGKPPPMHPAELQALPWLVAGDVAEGRLLHLAPQWCAEPLPVYLIYLYSNFYPAKLRRFIEALREGLHKGMGLRAREDGTGAA